MRLWTLHPRYLDSRGLVALWRETLLAREVLRGRTAGYRHHPQLERFRATPAPLSAINAYLRGVYDESLRRGYSFDPAKLAPVRSRRAMRATSGQVAREWEHLMQKLRTRSPDEWRRWRGTADPQCHPMFRIAPGPVESWERSSP